MTPAGTPAPDDAPAGQLGSVTAVGLVAARELRTRLRSKAFLITTAVFVVLLVAGSVVIALVSGTTLPSTVGFAGPAAPLAGAVSAQAATGREQLRTVVVADEAAGRAELAAGRLDALVLGTPQVFRVEVAQQLDPGLGSVLGAVAHQQAVAGQVARLGGDPARVRAAVDGATVPVQALRPPQHVDGTRIALGVVTGVLIYLSLLVWGQAVPQGVVEEKSSRVVELLLAAVRPWQLMAGKVLGIGTVGLIQTATVGLVGVVAGLVTGALALPVASAAAAVGWLIVWYLLGFTVYALLFAALGALVSRQEDIASVTSPGPHGDRHPVRAGHLGAALEPDQLAGSGPLGDPPVLAHADADPPGARGGAGLGGRPRRRPGGAADPRPGLAGRARLLRRGSAGGQPGAPARRDPLDLTPLPR